VAELEADDVKDVRLVVDDQDAWHVGFLVEDRFGWARATAA
jgi:hypothetical protein